MSQESAEQKRKAGQAEPTAPESPRPSAQAQAEATAAGSALAEQPQAEAPAPAASSAPEGQAQVPEAASSSSGAQAEPPAAVNAASEAQAEAPASVPSEQAQGPAPAASSAPAVQAEAPAALDAHAAKDVRVTGKSGRPYLHEIDMVRVITALSVVAVHTTAFTVGYNTTHLGRDLQQGVVAVLHFTREVFLVISAFVLTYTYAKRPSFSTGRFWKRRGLGVLLPYIVFSFFYVGISTPLHPWGDWFQAAFWHTLRGDASYQLYYILLSVELYIFLPVLLWMLSKVERWPWRVLGICFVVQLAMMYFDFHYIAFGEFGRTGWGGWINKYGWRVLPFYEFYIVLGAFGALYLRQVHDWIRSHGRWVVTGFLAGLAILWARFGWDIWIDHRAAFYANSVFQPVMVVFSLAMAVFLFWIGCSWAYSRVGKKPPGAFFWGLLADAAFGIYLIHAYTLNQTLKHVGAHLPHWLPAPICVVIVWFIAAGSAATISSLALYIPGLARLVGRPARPTWLSDAGEALLGRIQGRQPALATTMPAATNGKAPQRQASRPTAVKSQAPAATNGKQVQNRPNRSKTAKSPAPTTQPAPRPNQEAGKRPQEKVEAQAPRSPTE